MERDYQSLDLAVELKSSKVYTKYLWSTLVLNNVAKFLTKHLKLYQYFSLNIVEET